MLNPGKKKIKDSILETGSEGTYSFGSVRKSHSQSLDNLKAVQFLQ
jgi:hypothetical protein